MHASRPALVVALLVTAACDSKNDESLQPEYTEPSESLEDPSGRQEAINIAERKAEAILRTTGDTDLEGVARFAQLEEGVKVVVEVTQAPPGAKSMLVYDAERCDALREKPAREVFELQASGSEDAPEGALGLVNVKADGEGRFDRVVPDVTLHPELEGSLMGKVVALHAEAEAQSSIIACGIIDAEP